LNARENRNVFSIDLNVPSESLSVTVLGREFQVAGGEQRKARLANAVLVNGSDNRVDMVECRVRTLFWIRSYAAHLVFVLLAVFGLTLFKNGLKLRRFKSDRDEIWQDCSSRKYVSIDGIGFHTSR